MTYLITRRADYALRLLLGLGRYPAGTRLSARRLSEEMLIPLPMLYTLLKPLSGAGLIRTYAGARGGLELARSLDEITLWDIIATVERAPEVSPCVEDPGFCPLAPSCPVRRRWARLQRIIKQELQRTTLAELAEELNVASQSMTLYPALVDET